MDNSKVPVSLRSGYAARSCNKKDFGAGYALTAACLIAAGSFTNAEAQQAPTSQGASPILPPVTVNAPKKQRHHAASSKPTTAQLKARAALRRKRRQAAAAATRATPLHGSSSSLPIMARVPGGDPYA
ncbi:MAG: hypothetical protein EPN75_09765, partial [Beijerinckiaceae bacterium]